MGRLQGKREKTIGIMLWDVSFHGNGTTLFNSFIRHPDPNALLIFSYQLFKQLPATSGIRDSYEMFCKTLTFYNKHFQFRPAIYDTLF